MFDMSLGILGIAALFIFYIVVVLSFIVSILGIMSEIITSLFRNR